MHRSGTVVIETIESKALQGNPLGDPHVRRVPVYLPPGYEESDAAYPVVFVLTGFTGRGTMLLNDSAWDDNLAQRMDRLIADGRAQPMILVMPDCFTRLGGSQYLNSGAVGRYEDHVVQELVPFIDGRYRSRAPDGYRAVMGKSSGGYGSVVLAMRHPDVFHAFACHSGDMYFEYCYKPDFPKFLTTIGKFGGLEKFLDELPTIRPKNKDFFAVLNAVAMAACYSPNPDSPYGFDLPFDEETGELRGEVWDRWLSWDPVYMLPKHLDALRKMKLVFLDCGMRDEFNLQWGARIFSQRLAEAGIAFRHEEFDDGHMNVSYRYDVSLPAISEAFGS